MWFSLLLLFFSRFFFLSENLAKTQLYVFFTFFKVRLTFFIFWSRSRVRLSHRAAKIICATDS